MNKDKKITRFSQCSDPEGYKKKDREWIDLYKLLYSGYTLDELIDIDKSVFMMADKIRGLEQKIEFLIMIHENNVASLTAIDELIQEKAEKQKKERGNV